MLLPALVRILREDGQAIRGVFERNDVALRDKEGLPQYKAWFPLPGEETPSSPIVEITENDAAAVQVLGGHHRLPVLPGPAELPLPEGAVKAVVGVSGNEANADF